MEPYKIGKLKITHLSNNRFILEGDCNPKDHSSDHFQLIYEALEIAAHSDDKFASDYADMVAELMILTANWDEHS